ncbi:1-deoxy-D-xylulose-5-phosphate reductoisomerase [Natronobacillus azotifigens]|uniref:1-deoxy-D-xylulose 5-phosphate reductoisomerase n=1 Tax=Natronobacillus azotifigens TaxID=472978 RepID=A0A9J6RAJ9_9BACI|nr:1-deoxy-D-xylulose-5-phosphate reductoisomerase [Natronobacillus azotifigens]MCZ0702597.1 1-deoxy-D-xylulose-5-phosphate reductoisomerase [Natronobacillus azotifigens]
MKKITLLGATGSIGIQTLEVIRQYPQLFSVHAFAFGKNVKKAIPLIREFQPKILVVQDMETKHELQQHYAVRTEILVGAAGMVEVSIDPETDVLVNAVMGSVGLDATIQAIEKKKQIAIANKETLVTAGHLVMALAQQHQVQLLPVDSEHSAIFQCLQGEKQQQVERIILTASGGSFRDTPREALENVTVEDALKHPNWNMGAKITIDSASMMNKGLEVIEAHWLFNIPYDKIDVILHKESIIHSMVEFQDRSIIAQLGNADMRIPIQYALTYPNRMPLQESDPVNFIELGKMHFQEMSFERFPCLEMAYQAGKEGGTMPAVLNAANEQAVALFLQKKISFLAIEKVILEMLNTHQSIQHPDLETIQAVDQETRLKAIQFVTR